MFSEAELLLAGDRQVILTKDQIIEKVYERFGAISRQLHTVYMPIQKKYPHVFSMIPKISRGEKYRGMPWVMLDHPRCFAASPGHFAQRTMFWWGHYFVASAQFSGDHLKPMAEAIQKGILPSRICGYPLHAGSPADIWEHQLPQQGIFPIDECNPFLFEKKGSTIKLAVSVPIANSHHIDEVSVELGKLITGVFSP